MLKITHKPISLIITMIDWKDDFLCWGRPTTDDFLWYGRPTTDDFFCYGRPTTDLFNILEIFQTKIIDSYLHPFHASQWCYGNRPFHYSFSFFLNFVQKYKYVEIEHNLSRITLSFGAFFVQAYVNLVYDYQ